MLGRIFAPTSTPNKTTVSYCIFIGADSKPLFDLANYVLVEVLTAKQGQKSSLNTGKPKKQFRTPA